MNDRSQKMNQGLLQYQTQRLRALITEMVHCCEDRKFFESQKFGLPQAELRCLMLFDGQRYMTVTSMAEKLDVAKSRVTKILNGLLVKGLVEQVGDPKDGRITLVCKSPLGQRKSEEVESFYEEIHRKILMQIDSRDRKKVLSHMELLRSAMEAVKEQLV
jgi:DNA-binding MarR family transcriptional regulator